MGEKERENFSVKETGEIKTGDLEDDAIVVWLFRPWGLEFDVDGRFIKRLGKTIERYGQEVKLRITDGAIFAEIEQKEMRKPRNQTRLIF